MKTLNQYIKEKLIINKDYREAKIVVKSYKELKKIITDRYEKLGPGTKQDPINFNDIDVSNIDSFCDNKGKGIFCVGLFEYTRFKYIDISDWDVSNIKLMSGMFFMCKELKSVGDISKWNVSKVTDMNSMFNGCNELEFIGDISDWNVSNVKNMEGMFYNSKFNGDISDWNVSRVKSMGDIFSLSPLSKNPPKWYKE